MVPKAMLNAVKLVTLETCQVYGMRTIFVIDVFPVHGEHGTSAIRGSWIGSGIPAWDAWNEYSGGALAHSAHDLIRLVVLPQRQLRRGVLKPNPRSAS